MNASTALNQNTIIEAKVRSLCVSGKIEESRT